MTPAFNPDGPTKIYALVIPYYKQGDDLACALVSNHNDTSAAFLAMHKMLQYAANIYGTLDNFALDGLIRVEFAGTHTVLIECTPKVAVLLGKFGVDLALENDEYDEDDTFHSEGGF